MITALPADAQQVTTIVLYAEMPVWRHNLRATGHHPAKYTARCGTVAPAHTGRVFDCTFRVYAGHAGHRKLILRLPIHVVVRRGRPANVVFEDGSFRLRLNGTEWLKGGV